MKNQNDRAECRKKAMTNGEVRVLEQASKLRWHNIGGQEIAERSRNSRLLDPFLPVGEFRTGSLTGSV